MSRVGAKEKIRRFLLANIGRVIESRELETAADGAVQYSRRLRELREQEGWPILSHNDTTDLKPGQYLLKERPPEKTVAFARGISAKLRAEVLDQGAKNVTGEKPTGIWLLAAKGSHPYNSQN